MQLEPYPISEVTEGSLINSLRSNVLNGLPEGISDTEDIVAGAKAEAAVVA